MRHPVVAGDMQDAVFHDCGLESLVDNIAQLGQGLGDARAYIPAVGAALHIGGGDRGPARAAPPSAGLSPATTLSRSARSMSVRGIGVRERLQQPRRLGGLTEPPFRLPICLFDPFPHVG